MNTDDFESQLKRQILRPMPENWRAEILSTAQKAAPASLKDAAGPWWRELLWPCAQAWAGLAAAWVLILVLNIAATESSPSATQIAKDATLEKVLAERRELYAELTGWMPTPMAEPPKRTVPRPHSQRHAPVALA